MMVDGNFDCDGGVVMSGGLFGLLDYVVVFVWLVVVLIDDIGVVVGCVMVKVVGVVIDDMVVML